MLHPALQVVLLDPVSYPGALKVFAREVGAGLPAPFDELCVPGSRRVRLQSVKPCSPVAPCRRLPSPQRR